MIKNLANIYKSLTYKDKINILFFIIGLIIAIGLGTSVTTLFIQLINPQVDLKLAAIIVGALLSGIVSGICFILFFRKNNEVKYNKVNSKK